MNKFVETEIRRWEGRGKWGWVVRLRLQSLLNIINADHRPCAAVRKRVQVTAIDLGEEDMADSTKEEKN